MAVKISPLNSDTLTPAGMLLYKNWHKLYAPVLNEERVQQKTYFYFQEYLEEKKETCWIAGYGKRVAGIITVTSNCIDEIVVDTMYRRRNIASQLVSVALNHFSERGFDSAQAGCESFNEGGQKFFSALGWKIIGSQPIDFVRGETVEALVYSHPVPSRMAEVS